MRDRDGFETLRRIALLLLALAVLADRAGTRSPAVRCLVLDLLRPAQAAAHALAAETVPLLDHAQFPGDTPGDTTDDAARLAQSFRALALVFLALSHLHRLRARSARQRQHDSAAPRNADRRHRVLAWRRARAPPTPHGRTFPASTQKMTDKNPAALATGRTRLRPA